MKIYIYEYKRIIKHDVFMLLYTYSQKLIDTKRNTLKCAVEYVLNDI